MTTAEKFLQMLLAIAMFVAVDRRHPVRRGRLERQRKPTGWSRCCFLLPTALMLAVGLLYPGVRTIYQSFFDADGDVLHRPRQLPDDLHPPTS